MMNDTRQIFETPVVRQRRTSALAQPDYPDFLDRLIAEELASRLELIERQFEKCLIMGPTTKCLVGQVAKSGKLKQVFDQSSTVFESEWLPFKDNSLDCIIAPPGLELANDLPGALIQINRALKPDGLFLAAMYGGSTLAELRHAWILADEECTGGVRPRVAPFIDVRQAGNLLQRAGFALPVADMEIFTVRYDDSHALMKEIKAMGFANPLIERTRSFTGKTLLSRVETHYRELFSDDDGRVRATIEVNYLTGWCPHENQQKPLKPGSAEMRLADILKNADEVT